MFKLLQCKDKTINETQMNMAKAITNLIDVMNMFFNYNKSKQHKKNGP